MLNKYRTWRKNGHSRLISILAAPLLLACAAAVGLIVGLSGCNAPTQASARSVAQSNLDALEPACRDGIQYLVTPWYSHSTTVVRRTKLDGTGYRCSIQKSAARVVEEWEQ